MPADYLLDVDDDLLIKDGDFVAGESTNQHQSSPYQEIQKQLEADGMKVRKIQIFNDGKINVDAFYL